MIANDRDGAITRTDEPERSFGGTTGTSPYWPIPAGVGNRVTGTVTCRRRDARRGARPRRRWLARASAKRTMIWPGAVQPI
jgi:hypothetical protein